MKKIKAYILYNGEPQWYNATLVFENGWASFGHCCSSQCFMPGDLWLNRKERQEILTKMGYEVELIETCYLEEDSEMAWLIEKHKCESNWKSMQEEYAKFDPREPLHKPAVAIEVLTQEATLKEKFIAAVKKNGSYPIRQCAMCAYPMKYLTRSDGALFIDTGCDCVTYGPVVKPASWEDFDFYLEPGHGHIPSIENFIREVNNPNEPKGYVD